MCALGYLVHCLQRQGARAKQQKRSKRTNCDSELPPAPCRNFEGNELCGATPPALAALCQSGILCYGVFDLPACAPPPTFTCAEGEDATTCAALADLYDATDGLNWVNNGGWSDAAASIPTSYCTFAGVECEGVAVRYLCVLTRSRALHALHFHCCVGCKTMSGMRTARS